MKINISRILVFLFVIATTVGYAKDEFLQPYILIGESGKSVSATAEDIIGNFFMKGGIKIIGKYHPMDDQDKYVIVVTNSDLLKAVSKGKPSAAFAAVMRIAITKHGEMTYVSCQNPVYWGNAYYQEDFPVVEKHILAFQKRLMRSFPKMRGRFNRQFGSRKEFTAEDLRHYHYIYRAEYFEDMEVLKTFSSYKEAVKTIENNLTSSKDYMKVFEKEIPGKKIKLYGIDLEGENGEKELFQILDKAEMKHTAFFPYEVLVIDKKVYMLHGRFRIPLGFPDIKLLTYVKIRSTAKKIENKMKTFVE